MDIQWFPGHMAKAKRQVKEDLKLIDVVIEILDARIPASSRNPDIDQIAGGKPRLIILNKADLANPASTRRWEDFFKKTGCPAVAVDSLGGRGVRETPGYIQKLFEPKMTRLAASGRRPRPARCMILGIPNVGKSLFVNKLVGRRAAKTENVPGVTRGRQWINVAGDLELMDTPGILWPKLNDEVVSFRLAVTGAIKEQIYDLNAVALELLSWLAGNYPEAIRERYKIDELPDDSQELLEAIGAQRGYYKSGGIVDTLKSAKTVLKEFRGGILGCFTLEEPAEH
jgi:ribosome biogenesis GTPase A